ncbi:acetyltransferase (GNAT) family protein [Actinocrispum wychmicini]|uniref:Acetyltransferase (GNAT) family protein n=2 Tax=Actinocrispum wychmicini TaxID=1213861 RepID=A0A4R2JZ07_9PSEU|nr:acetyltransferase (GNAT) family protein [Actinocrispum wychmicini]
MRPTGPADQATVAQLVTESWGAPTVVVGHGRVLEPGRLPGLIAEQDGEVVGLLTYSVEGTTAELVTFNSFQDGQGIGTALLNAMVERVRTEGCARIILMTTNDNTDAIRYYQRRGFRMRELRVGAVATARASKPEIPLLGNHGIPITDELELELTL